MRPGNWEQAVARWGELNARILCVALEEALDIVLVDADWATRWHEVNARVIQALRDEEAA